MFHNVKEPNMYVTFSLIGKNGRKFGSKIMACFYDDPKKQGELMHNNDITKQVKKWLETNSGNPPKFYSRINIEEFISDEEAGRRKIIY